MTKKVVVSNAALGALTNKNAGTPEPAYHPPFQTAAQVISDKMKNSVVLEPEFTGLARSVICINNQGFNNFQICTLFVEKGKVTKMELSDMWQNFETISILDHVNHLSLIHLNNKWQHGKALEI